MFTPVRCMELIARKQTDLNDLLWFMGMVFAGL
jgi:hypothetical protein